MSRYFDNAASMEISQHAWHAATTDYAIGNPSSTHHAGKQARQVLNESRLSIARYIGIDNPQDIYFTSGATEAANLLIQGYLNTLRLQPNAQRNEIIISSIEHPAVYQAAYAMTAHGFIVHELAVNQQGHVDTALLARYVSSRTALVCVMAVNNETGSIQPINALAKTVKEKEPDVFFVCDSVQQFAKLNIKINLDYVDALFMSGHKIGADKGVGCFYCNPRFKLQPLFFGGKQELSYRPGTENVFGIKLLAAALEESIAQLQARLDYISSLGETLTSLLDKANIHYYRLTSKEDSSPYILSLAFPGFPSTEMVNELALAGFAVSQGSACSSHKTTPSRVLQAMQLPKHIIQSTIRISFSMQNTKHDVEALAEYLIELTGS